MDDRINILTTTHSMEDVTVAKKKQRSRKTKHEDPSVDQLDQIRKLLILQLVSSGVQANHIALVLGVGKSAISEIVPARLIKKGK